MSFMFDRVGVIEFDAKVGQRGRDDGSRHRGRRRRRLLHRGRPRDRHLAWNRLRDVQKALEAKFGEPRKAAPRLARRRPASPSTTRPARRSSSLLDALDDNDDVQNVYSNVEFSDALMAKASA